MGLFCAILIMETAPGKNIGRWVFGLSFQQLEKDWKQLKGKKKATQKLDIPALKKRLSQKGFSEGAPVLVRIFKVENKLEVWLKKKGRYNLFQTYPICAWSGQLGPKLKQGDKQSPEGFYQVSEKQLNPNSKYYRSFNLGFPNAYDKALGRTGSFLMVHGDCKSIGCYAMTDPVMGEIWHLITTAFQKGQVTFQVQALPFALTKTNLLRYSGHQWLDFWKELKPGYDYFEQTGLPPTVRIKGQHYSFTSNAI